MGGAVRDKLMGHPIKERDWVVVGVTPEEMVFQGYKPVGKEFPVFLHPQTHEEYALARTEKKVAKGYKGFTFYTSPAVTLEEDLKRRDLSINAIAEDSAGHLIDPYHGQEDIQQRWLRHVSPAFSEDPVRILRVARFAARFADFKVHPETLSLMKKMVAAGEVEALVAERVWKENERALTEKNPSRFYEVLENSGALKILFPELSPFGQHQKIFDRMISQTEEPTLRFSGLLFSLKEPEIQRLCERYKVPNSFLNLALLVNRQYNHYRQINTASAETILDFLNALDAFRRPERFEQFLMAAQVITEDTQIAAYLRKVWKAVKSVDTQPLQAMKLQGADFAKALREKQVTAITSTIRE